MKRKMKYDKITVFSVLYTVFTIMCVCLGWMFSEYKILIFQIWYQSTAGLGIMLAIAAAVLLMRLLQFKKLRMEFNNRKG
ncbi:MAG: conjugal transfer protein [Massiliimalia sp.]|jgi:hypothetical protein